MLNTCLRMCRQLRARWLMLAILGISIFIGSPKSNTSAQDVATNEVFLPIVNSQSNSPADAEHDHTGIGHIPEHGRFTANDGHVQSWPPQVKYIDEMAWDNRLSAAIAMAAVEVDAAISITAQDSELGERLGERYTFINAHPIREKGNDAVLGQRVTYFSYSNNVTIKAIVRNGAVATIETIAASDWQPSLKQNEVDAAIDIARQYWQGKGNSRVNNLQGFTIQTFQTEGAGGYYDTRMTYVSFHMDEVSNPELLTWVDLTTETVFKAAVDNGIENGGVQYVQ